MWTVEFWKQTLERTIVGAATAGLSALGGAQVDPSAIRIDLGTWAWIVAMGALIAFLVCIVSAPIGRPGSASVLRGPAPEPVEWDGPELRG